VSPFDTVDEYLAAVPADQRVALEYLRARIRSVAPEAEEGLSYGVPAFKLRGRSLVSYGAARNHCSFFVQSPAVMEAHQADLAGYDTSKGTVRFAADRPLPAALVAKLVRARIAENEDAESRRAAKAKARV
jgi:uncharacterized protein YdhG (YjbR/CyaY superfamily)